MLNQLDKIILMPFNIDSQRGQNLQRSRYIHCLFAKISSSGSVINGQTPGKLIGGLTI